LILVYNFSNKQTKTAYVTCVSSGFFFSIAPNKKVCASICVYSMDGDPREKNRAMK